MRIKFDYSDPLSWAAVGIMAILIIFFTEGIVETISLFTNYDYTIAKVYETHRGNKLEPIVDYSYVVNGKVYTCGAERDGPFKMGSRYVVRYGKFAPQGNEFDNDIPIPDSIQQDTGRVWRDFLHHNGL